MSSLLFTIGTETFRKHWSLMMATVKGFTPARQYESFALITTNVADQSLTLRLANDMGGVRVVLKSSQDDGTTLVVTRSVELAVLMEHITRALPFLIGGSTTWSESPKAGVCVLSSGSVRQEVQWKASMIDDFPNDAYFHMQPRVTFALPGFDRLLRLAHNSASDNPRMRSNLTSGLFLTLADDGSLSMESAGDSRGVSRVHIHPEIADHHTAFTVLLPYESVQLLSRAAGDDPITISADPGSAMVGWHMGNMDYICRSMGDRFVTIAPMYGGDEIVGATVPYIDFTNSIGLICANAEANQTAAAQVIFHEDLSVEVRSTHITTESVATMPGLCSGSLPYTCTLNARQILEILRDLRSKGNINLSARVLSVKYGEEIRTTPTLAITSPDDPAYLHVAILMQNK